MEYFHENNRVSRFTYAKLALRVLTRVTLRISFNGDSGSDKRNVLVGEADCRRSLMPEVMTGVK